MLNGNIGNTCDGNSVLMLRLCTLVSIKSPLLPCPRSLDSSVSIVNRINICWLVLAGSRLQTGGC